MPYFTLAWPLPYSNPSNAYLLWGVFPDQASGTVGHDWMGTAVLASVASLVPPIHQGDPFYMPLLLGATFSR